MAKRRKRTSKNVPAKGRLRDMADRLWSITVRTDWNWKCAVCQASRCEAHHLIPRENEATRFDLQNGIALCSSHHRFCPQVSPHQNAGGWMRWLEHHQPLRFEWYVETIANGQHLKFDGIKNAPYYCDVIRSFQQYVEPETFIEIVTVQFSTYLIECEKPG